MHFAVIAMADNDVFGMLSAEDKLDGTHYPLWACMMRHVPSVASASEGESTTRAPVVVVGPPTVEQAHWDGVMLIHMP